MMVWLADDYELNMQQRPLDEIQAEAKRRLDKKPETVITDTQEDRSDELAILRQDVKS